MLFSKKILGPLIMGTIEIISYFKLQPRVEDLENFFFIWMIISIVLILLNVFNMDSNSTGALSVLMSGSTSGTSYGKVAGAASEHMHKTDKNDYRETSGLLYPKNLVYMVFIIINLIGFWIF